MDWTKEVNMDQIEEQLRAKILEDAVMEARFADFEAKKKEFEAAQVEHLLFTEKELEEKIRVPERFFGGTPIRNDVAVRWTEAARNQPIFAGYPRTEEEARRRQIQELLEKDYTFIDPSNNMAGRIASRIEFKYQEELEVWKDIFKGMLAPFFYRVYVEIVEEDRARERQRAGEKSHAEGT